MFSTSPELRTCLESPWPWINRFYNLPSLLLWLSGWASLEKFISLRKLESTISRAGATYELYAFFWSARFPIFLGNFAGLLSLSSRKLLHLFLSLSRWTCLPFHKTTEASKCHLYQLSTLSQPLTYLSLYQSSLLFLQSLKIAVYSPPEATLCCVHTCSFLTLWLHIFNCRLNTPSKSPIAAWNTSCLSSHSLLQIAAWWYHKAINLRVILDFRLSPTFTYNVIIHLISHYKSYWFWLLNTSRIRPMYPQCLPLLPLVWTGS